MLETILLVVGDADLRLAFHDRLLSMGFDVVIENDGQSALSRISLEATRSPIQGVMFDVQCPGVNSIDVLSELCLRHPEIPVIVLFTFSDRAQLIEVRRLGASTYHGTFDRERDWERIYWIFHNA
jgi:DNA-binding NarL/FixJ family response regulator